MRVLITGAAGFVGTAFRQWFADNLPDDDGSLVDCVDLVPAIDWPGAWPLMLERREGRTDVRRWFHRELEQPKPTEYDLVIHLAAVVGGRATIDGEPMAVATDLAIDADFWQWVLRARPKQVAYFSSSAAYPIAKQNHEYGSEIYSQAATVGWERAMQMSEDEINLDRIKQPDAIYGLVKLVGEQQARHVAEALPDTHVLVLRPFSGYGIGQSDDYPAPSIVGRAHRREDPIVLWSDAVRDFVDIRDVVEVTMRALAAGHRGPLNICSGNATSFSEFARIAANLVGYDPRIEVLPGMPTGVAYRVGDPALMRQVTGGHPNSLRAVSDTIAAMLMRLDGRA